MQEKNIRSCVLTGIELSGHGGAIEEAGPTLALEVLVVAIEGIGSMGARGIGEVAGPIHLYLAAVDPSLLAGPLKSCLKFNIRGLFIGHAPLLKLSH